MSLGPGMCACVRFLSHCTIMGSKHPGTLWPTSEKEGSLPKHNVDVLCGSVLQEKHRCRACVTLSLWQVYNHPALQQLICG